MRLSVSVLAIGFLSAALAGCSQDDKGSGGDRKKGKFISAKDWEAWVNKQPPGPARLHVKGKVTVAQSNDTPELVFDSLSKSNPPALNLKLVVRRSDGAGTPSNPEKEVHYESTEHTGVNKVVIWYPNKEKHEITDIKIVQ